MAQPGPTPAATWLAMKRRSVRRKAGAAAMSASNSASVEERLGGGGNCRHTLFSSESALLEQNTHTLSLSLALVLALCISPSIQTCCGLTWRGWGQVPLRPPQVPKVRFHREATLVQLPPPLCMGSHGWRADPGIGSTSEQLES